MEEEAPEETGDAWGKDELTIDESALGAGGWGGDLDLGDMGVDLAAVEETVPEVEQRAMNPGESLQAKWLKKRKLPVDFVAAGEFEEALNLLKRRIGLMNAEPLQNLFMEVYWATCSAVPGVPQGPPVHWPLLSKGHSKDKDVSPVTLYTAQYLSEQVKKGHAATTQGQFQNSLDIFRAVLQAIPLSLATSMEEEQNLQEIIDICRRYITAMRLEVTRKTLGPDQLARSLELSAYLTCCKLQPAHVTITLRVAMSTAFKAQNFITAASFAKRLVQGENKGADAKVLAQARQLLQVCDEKGSDAHVIDFDSKAPTDDLTLCCGSLKPVPPAQSTVRCPYCNSIYMPEFKGKLCSTCELSQIGANTLGIQLR